MAAQETLLAQTKRSLPPLQEQLAQQSDLIAALAGRMPDSEQPRVYLATLILPLNVPLSLPARLVGQRPGVRAAEANLHAAGAQVGFAIAARLPAITLSSSAGGSPRRTARLPL